VYRSERTLPELVRRILEALEPIADRHEIILVNDGSPDGSWDAIQALVSRDPRIRGLDLMRNYGQHNAVLAGIRSARHAVTVTLDDDLQNPPEEIPRLLRKLWEGYDVVYGVSHSPQQEMWRRVAARITKLALQSTMGAETARKVSAFRALRTQLRDGFRDYRGPYVSIDVLLTWATDRFAKVDVTHARRRLGPSNYTFGRLLTHALNMITGFSTVPLQAASLVGFAATLLGVLLLAYVLIRYLAHGSVVPGFPFLASIISIFAGAQLFAIGIIGEYLARMHSRTMERPTFVVRAEAGGSSSNTRFDDGESG